MAKKTKKTSGPKPIYPEGPMRKHVALWMHDSLYKTLCAEAKKNDMNVRDWMRHKLKK